MMASFQVGQGRRQIGIQLAFVAEVAPFALHRRADARVEAMFAAGLVEETRLLVERHGDGFPALSSLGYREALGVLRGTWDTAEAIRRTQVATHRLVRMQAAWFASDDARIEWVDAERADAVTDAVERAARPPVP